MSRLPDHLREPLERYASDGVPLGSCFEAAIANDLLEFFARADHMTRACAFDVAMMICNDLPSICHGSRRVYRAWIAAHAADRRGDDVEISAAHDELTEAVREARAFRR